MNNVMKFNILSGSNNYIFYHKSKYTYTTIVLFFSHLYHHQTWASHFYQVALNCVTGNDDIYNQVKVIFSLVLPSFHKIRTAMSI